MGFIMEINLRKIASASIVACSILASSLASAEPRTVPTTIENVRSLSTGSVIVTVASNTLANPTAGNLTNDVCTSRAFTINSDNPGSNVLTANALTALAAGLEVQVEIPSSNTTCGFGTNIQSIFVLQ